MQCTVLAVVIWTDNANFVVLNDSGDRSRDLNVEGSLRPLTSMAWPLMVVSTPFAKAMGFLPIRDISHYLPLPDVGENFSAYALLGSLTVGQQAVGRGDDSHAEAA